MGGIVLTTTIAIPKLQFPPAVPVNWSEVGESQVRKLIEIGVPNQVGVDKDKYLDDAMAIVKQYEYRIDLAEIGLNRLCVVPYNVSDEFLAEASHVKSYINLSKCTVQKGVVLPDGLAVMQGQFGPKYKNTAPRDVLKILSPLEEGGILKEGLVAYSYYGDDLLRESYMDFPRSRAEYGSVPDLDLDGRPGLSYDDGGRADPCFGSVSRGKY